MTKISKNNHSHNRSNKYKVAPGVQKSIYPLEYNRNDPMSGFNEWAEYIRRENVKNMYSGIVRVYRMNVNMNLLGEIREEKAAGAGEYLVNQALQIINTKK